MAEKQARRLCASLFDPWVWDRGWRGHLSQNVSLPRCRCDTIVRPAAPTVATPWHSHCWSPEIGPFRQLARSLLIGAWTNPAVRLRQQR